jgi:MtN3 and saliva related transmembrane protein
MSTEGRQAPASYPRLMDSVYALGMAASSFGLVMATAPLLQARTIWRGRSSEDVSQSFLAIIAFGAALWAVYGFADGNWFIFVPNVVAVVTNMLTLVLARRFAVAAPEGEAGQPSERPRRCVPIASTVSIHTPSADDA